MKMTDTPYLRNTWYVAAWARDVGPSPHGVTLLEEPVLLRRDEAGVARAIGGRCPHRFAPLAQGKVVDDTIECPYHGLRFDMRGECVFNPHLNGALPKARLPSYPLVERHGLLWIWMGDAQRADAALIPDFSWLESPKCEYVGGTVLAEGNYQLYSDNILDLAHANFVHPGLKSNAWTIGDRHFAQDGDVVTVRYTRLNDQLSEAISAVLDCADMPMDMYVTVRWHAPAVLFLDFRADLPGTSEASMRALPSLHAFTPQDRKTTHYFWAVARNFRLEDVEFSAGMRTAFVAAFEQEDLPIISAQQRMIGDRDFWDLKPISLPGDNGGLRARRTLQKLIESERNLTIA
jgi:vanillate O-demethylase monooxygenase subunit